MQEFYNEYNWCKEDFSRLAHVGRSTLEKYMRGETIRESSRVKIERAVMLIKKYHLRRPTFDREKSMMDGFWYRVKYHGRIDEYNRKVKEIFDKEFGLV